MTHGKMRNRETKKSRERRPWIGQRKKWRKEEGEMPRSD